MDFTSSFVLQQYADMPKDEDESSDSSESEYETDDEDDTLNNDVEVNPISLETQYINAMVAKINAENEKNHPERSAKTVWEMLYGDMKNYEATSSDEGQSSSDDSDDDLSTEYNSGRDKKLTWDDIEKDLDEPPDDLLDLKKSMPEFLLSPKELKTEEAKRKKKKVIVKKKVEKQEKKPVDQKKELSTIPEAEGKANDNVEEVNPTEIKNAGEEEEEVEVEETEEEEQERLVRENKERIAQELADARQEWLALHTWLIAFRLKHNMTIMDFLEYVEADPEMMMSWQVKQLLNKNAHKFNPSESHTTWGGRTRKLLKKSKIDAESGKISHKKYMQLRLLHYRSAEYSPDNELQYTLRMGYESPPEVEEEDETIMSNMFDDMESLTHEEESPDANNEYMENLLMADEDDNKLDEKYTPVHEDNVAMRSTFQYESGSEISDSDDSYGDSDSSSGDEFFWVGGAEGHNMRKEQRKIAREDYNVLHEIFDTEAERQFKREMQEKREREAKEAAERCPTDVAGKIAWRLKQFEKAKAEQEAEDEARRIEQNLIEQAERERRKQIRKSNKKRKARAMNLLRALNPETLFI